MIKQAKNTVLELMRSLTLLISKAGITNLSMSEDCSCLAGSPSYADNKCKSFW